MSSEWKTAECGDEEESLKDEDIFNVANDVETGTDSTNNNRSHASVPTVALKEVERVDDDDDDTVPLPLSPTESAIPTTVAVLEEEDKLEDGYRLPMNPVWTKATSRLRRTITNCVIFFALRAVRYPKRCVALVTVLSLVLAATGFFTNFRLELSLMVSFTPLGCLPVRHSEWINSPEGFPDQTNVIQIVLHNHGKNVLHIPQFTRVLEVIQTVTATPDYQHLCSQGDYLDFQTNQPTCRIVSASAFLNNHNRTLFHQSVLTDQDLQHMLSSPTLANGAPVFHDFILGNNIKNTTTGIIESAQSYVIHVYIPRKEKLTEQVEAQILQRLDTLRRNWIQMDHALIQLYNNNNNVLQRLTNDLSQQQQLQQQQQQQQQQQEEDSVMDRLLLSIDFTSLYAYQLEILRSILGDLYLVPVICVLMTGVTCFYFYRNQNHHPGNNQKSSHILLGIASVGTIVASMMTAYGLMFLCGVPYGILHQMLPFVILGIGLDDTFIITNTYFHITAQAERMQTKTTMEQRIRMTMEEIGSSISLTTITTVFAFLLGYLSSSLPGVRWLCLTAMSTISIDFLYQITYFVAFLVLDEQGELVPERVCCFRITTTQTPTDPDHDHHHHHMEDTKTTDASLVKNNTKHPQEDVCSMDNQKSVGNHKDHKHPGGTAAATTKDKREDTTNDPSATTDKADSTTDIHHDSNLHLSHRILTITKDKLVDTIKDPTTTTVKVVDKTTTTGGATTTTDTNDTTLYLSHRIMSWYSDILLRPATKIGVLLVFSLFFGICLYSCTKLEQKFDITDWVIEDSYLKHTFTSLADYSKVVRPVSVYFRHVDQTNETIQQQMIDYVTQLEALDQIGFSQDTTTTATNGPVTATADGSLPALTTTATTKVPSLCWVRDFQEIEKHYENDPKMAAAMSKMSFINKVDMALKDNVVRELYGQDIVRDEQTGDILASRCTLIMTDLDLKSVHDQIHMLADQREVTKRQPINNLNEENKENWPFFAFDDLFFYWETYTVAVQELIFTIIVGIAAVTLITFILIPHWTAVLITFPMIIILYVELLGLFQFFGLKINGLTYVCVVVAIGLLIDFIIHVLLRYYECAPTNNKTRDERVKETLETMGVSILIGGLTTLIGVLPISISTLHVFRVCFYAFFSMIVLGLSHGLILLPVILSLVGPTTSVMDDSNRPNKKYQHNK